VENVTTARGIMVENNEVNRSIAGVWLPRRLANVESEDVIVDPIMGGIGDIGKEVEDLGELHGVLIVVDEHVANDKDNNAVRLDCQAGLDIAGHHLMLDLGKREAL
jgi:hypothetical protein